MKMVKKLRIKFVAVFMAIMLVAALVLGGVLYFQQRAEMEYECMMYLLNIHNYENKQYRPIPANYPPYFVLEINNLTDTATVVLGDFFLAQDGVTTEDVTRQLIGRMEESGVLEEYHVRYFYGIRQLGVHRVSFIDISYIQYELSKTLGRYVLFAIPSLLALFVAAIFLSRWFSAPARQAIKDRESFITKVSHELKTPLSIIRANIDLVDGETRTSETDFVFGCENIRHECDRMTSLIEAMLMAETPALRDAGQDEPVDLTRLLQKEMLRFEVVAFDRGLTLTLDTEEGLSLRGDETQITRLIDIIVENAIKYCAPEGEIRVRAGKRQGMMRRGIQILCENTGERIPKELAGNIFKPFYQADPTFKGAGLGLSIAYEIVAAMNGEIRVDHKDGFNCFVIDI